MNIRERIDELGPWRQNALVGGYNTHAVNKMEMQRAWHPEIQLKRILPLVPEHDSATAYVYGGSEGVIAHKFAELGYDVEMVELDEDAIERAMFYGKSVSTDIEIHNADCVEWVRQAPPVRLGVSFGLLYHLDEPRSFIESLAETHDKLLFESHVSGLGNSIQRGDYEGELPHVEWEFGAGWLDSQFEQVGGTVVESGYNADDGRYWGLVNL